MPIIGDFIVSKCTQTAVYWGNPVEDGFGSVTYDAPIEILCRWEDKIQIMGSITGNQIVGFQNLSRSVVFVTRDLDEDGMLFLGTLADLTEEQKITPKSIIGSHIIKRIEKYPGVGSTTEFLRKVFLTPWLS